MNEFGKQSQQKLFDKTHTVFSNGLFYCRVIRTSAVPYSVCKWSPHFNIIEVPIELKMLYICKITLLLLSKLSVSLKSNVRHNKKETFMNGRQTIDIERALSEDYHPF